MTQIGQQRRRWGFPSFLLLLFLSSLLVVRGFAPPRIGRPGLLPRMAAHKRKRRNPSWHRNNPQGQNSAAAFASFNRGTLRYIINQVIRIKSEEGWSDESRQLRYGLERLISAHNSHAVARAGSILSVLPIEANESIPVQEYIMQAAAITGLLSLSTRLMDRMLRQDHVPSMFAYLALFGALRQAHRYRQLEDVMFRLARQVDQQEPIEVVAFNIYLASLCDEAMRVHGYKPQQDNCRYDSVGDLLAKARRWLRRDARELLGVEPDATSYATVLNAAARVGDRSLAQSLLDEQIEKGLQPSAYSYNSLLRAISREEENDREAWDLFHEMKKTMKPDRYTLDIMLLPLIRTNRVQEIYDMLDRLVERENNIPQLQEAFSSFLNTLVKGGQLYMARRIFDKYLLNSMPNVLQNIHFNILLSGYRRVVEASDAVEHGDDTARREAVVLYDTMKNRGIRPCEYTLTSMMGLVSTSEELSGLFYEIVVRYGAPITSALVRATVWAYGERNDPSSACWIFDALTSNGQHGRRNTRTWNALIGALARTKQQEILSVANSRAAKALSSSLGDNDVILSELSYDLDGMNCSDAALRVLNVMSDALFFDAPRPDCQSYCLATHSLHHREEDVSHVAMELFRNATEYDRIPTDGRFLNAVLRCFDANVDGALAAWKTMRWACLNHEGQTRNAHPSVHRSTANNLMACYHGLLFCCGRALRPDIALRIVYAMNKEDVPVNEMALKCYEKGKQEREPFGLGGPFEKALTMECTKYDLPREGESRVRIAL